MVNLSKDVTVNNGAEAKEEKAVVNNRPNFKGAEKFCFDSEGRINDLTRQAKDELIYQIGKVFDWCDIYPEWDYYSVGAIVEEWFYNKLDLLNLFVKSPFYNGNYAIEFDKPIYRSFDKQTYIDFIDSMKNWAKDLRLKETKIGNFTYNEIDTAIDRISDKMYHIQHLCALNYPVSYGTLPEEYRFFKEMKDTIKTSGKYAIHDYKAYLWEEWEQFCSFKRCMGWLEDRRAQFISAETEGFINEQLPKFKAKEGQRTSRVVNKLCKMMKLDTVTNHDLCLSGYSYDDNNENAYNKEFAHFADACNPFAVDKHIFLSLNPIDYLTMSWGTTWGSCHDIDKEDKHDRPSDNYSGSWSSGTLSYMLDRTSLVFYIPSSHAKQEVEENGEPVPRKEMRQMFHIGEEKFIQGRLYPYDQSDKGRYAEPEDYIQYREIVQNVLAELWGVPNLWTIKKGGSNCEGYTVTSGTHYTDYTHYNNVNISFLKGSTNDEKIYIGHNPICPKCGRQHTENANCFCNGCTEDGIWCAYHETFEPTDTDGYEIDGYGWVCEDALENSGAFARCESCGTWIVKADGGYEYSARDDKYFCDGHCAEYEGYYWLEYTSDWVHEDDISYSEIENEDLPNYNLDWYDLCWAIYDESGNETIAHQSDCTKIDGQWYWNDILVSIDGEYYRPEDTDTSEIDGELLPTIDANGNDEDGDSNYCWAIYNSCGDITIARVESCEMVHGKWYSRALCAYVVSKDEWALISECVFVDGEVTQINMSEMFELDNIA